MSRAFVKEDVDIPDRTRRVRSASGLPPGALNYLTSDGAMHLRGELETLRHCGAQNWDRIEELERILGSATVIGFPDELSESVAFGATVTVQAKDGRFSTYRIVGVDEVEWHQNAITWISPIGKVLLNAQLGEEVVLDGADGKSVKIVKVEFIDCLPKP